MGKWGYNLGCLPAQDSGHPIIIFLVGNRYKPSVATVTGRGKNPSYHPYEWSDIGPYS